MKLRKVNVPDKWNGWRMINIDKNSEIDYNINDESYLNSRNKYLLDNVINDNSYKLYSNIDTYSNRQILAWGCGSGKTTNLKVFCANTDKSTLIVVKTNEEIKRLVFDIKALNPKQSVCSIYEGCDTLKELDCNINSFSKYRIIVTNNWRALYEASYLFMNYFDHIKNSMTKREIVIFDEFQTPYIDIVVNHEKLISELYKRSLIYGKEIKLNENTIKTIINLDSDIFRKIFNHIPYMKNEKLYKERVCWLFNKLIEKLGDLSNTNIESDIIISQGIDDFIDDKTKFIILDATADILFKDSNYWNIERYNQKKVTLSDEVYFDTIALARRTRKRKNRHVKELLEEIKNIEDYILNNNSKKHLIITWKDTDHIDNLPNFIKENINKDIINKCEVIHYNSGKCRSTNEYIEYDSIIFLGEWFNNVCHAERLSEVLNARITPSDLVKAEIIQAIFRTQARIGKPISIAYFSKFRNELLDGHDSFEECICSILNLDESKIENITLLRRARNIAEEKLNKKTYEKVKFFMENFKIDNISSEIKVIKTSLKDLSKIVNYNFLSRRAAEPLCKALLEYFNIRLVL